MNKRPFRAIKDVQNYFRRDGLNRLFYRSFIDMVQNLTTLPGGGSRVSANTGIVAHQFKFDILAWYAHDHIYSLITLKQSNHRQLLSTASSGWHDASEILWIISLCVFITEVTKWHNIIPQCIGKPRPYNNRITTVLTAPVKRLFKAQQAFKYSRKTNGQEETKS